MTETDRQPPEGLAWRMIAAWGDLSGATRRLIAERPPEGALLMFAMLSGFFHFLGRTAAMWLDPATAGFAEGELLNRVAAEFASALVFRTLGLYAIAGLAGLLARAVGGTGGYYESRVALFWAALVAALPMLAVELAVALSGPALDPRTAAGLTGAGGLLFAWAAAQGIAVAHGFRRGWPIFAGLVVLAALLAAVAAGGGGSAT